MPAQGSELDPRREDWNEVPGHLVVANYPSTNERWMHGLQDGLGTPTCRACTVLILPIHVLFAALPCPYVPCKRRYLTVPRIRTLTDALPNQLGNLPAGTPTQPYNFNITSRANWITPDPAFLLVRGWRSTHLLSIFLPILLLPVQIVNSLLFCALFGVLS